MPATYYIQRPIQWKVGEHTTLHQGTSGLVPNCLASCDSLGLNSLEAPYTRRNTYSVESDSDLARRLTLSK